jgi:hypothetical protein
MILKFRIGMTDWKLIEGFKEVHYFNVKKELSNIDGNESPSQEFYYAWGSEERFNPSTVFNINLQNIGPTRDIGVIGRMKDEDDANQFLLLGCDEVFILNDEGKTIDRCY